MSLEETGRFGYAERPTGLTDSSHANAGVLGDVRGVVLDPKGTVFVLDRHSQQIVGFRPDGSVARVIRGGEGEGPGEFRLPMSLSSTDDGPSVVDYDLKRVTEFDWSGKLLRVSRLPTPAPWRHLIRRDTAWITYGAGGSSAEPAFHAVVLNSDVVEAGPGLGEEDQPFGVSVGLALGAAGEILVNTARPGVWMVLEGKTWTRRGTPLFRDDRPPLTERTAPNQYRTTPAQHTAAGIGMIGDSIVVQGISWLPRPFDWSSPPRRDEFLNSLGIYRRTGEHLLTVPLPPGVSTAFLSVDRKSERIFLPTTDPFPQAIEYKLVQCSRPR